MFLFSEKSKKYLLCAIRSIWTAKGGEGASNYVAYHKTELKFEPLNAPSKKKCNTYLAKP